MKVLDLFSGTKSVDKAILELYPDATIISVDFCKKYNPTHCVDILEFDYKQYDHFDVIWASPNCKEYSRAKATGVRNLEFADSLVKKSLEIIDYFKPKYWFIENPWTGLLKTREFMKELEYYRVDYCCYRKGCQKPTAIWTNLKEFQPKKCVRKECKSIVNYVGRDNKSHNKHLGCIGKNSDHYDMKKAGFEPPKDTYENRIRVPHKLLLDLFKRTSFPLKP